MHQRGGLCFASPALKPGEDKLLIPASASSAVWCDIIGTGSGVVVLLKKMVGGGVASGVAVMGRGW